MTDQSQEIKKAAGSEVTFMIPSTDQLGHLKEMEPGFKLTMGYRTQEDWAERKNQPEKCYFMGMKEIPNDKGEVVNCGVFASENEVFLSAQMVLVEAVKNLESKTPVQITYLGKKPNKSSDGSTNLFEIVTLN